MEYIYIPILLILISAIGFINYNKPKRLMKNSIVQEKIKNISEFLQEIEEYKKEYFTFSLKEDLNSKYKDVYDLFKQSPYKKIKDDNISKFLEIYPNLNKLVKDWNEEYIENELLCNSILLSNIDGKSLDEQQRRAVVVDEDNNLVLAGAGSGKTLTISGKVKYLVDVKNIKPEEILLILFTRKAADEIHERISQKLGINVEAKTFHKLVLDIIKEKRKKSPDISDNLDKVIDKYFKENIYKDKLNFKNLITFFACYINIPKDIEQFENLSDYIFNNQEKEYEDIDDNIYLDIDYLNNKKIVCFGGNKSWISSMKKEFKDWSFIAEDKLNFDTSLLNDADMIFIKVTNISHSIYYKIIANISECTELKYIKNSNINIIKKELALN